MTPRVRRLLLVSTLLGFAAGCAHHTTAPKAAGPARIASEEPAPPPVSRVTAPGTPFIRAEPAKPFDPRLVVTTQVACGDIFLHSRNGNGPRFQFASHLFRGQQAFILPFARNYGFSAEGHTDLTYEIDIRRPDGSHDGALSSAVLWQNEVSGTGMVLYPATTVSFFAEPKDPLGDYHITVRVTDHLAGETRELVQTVTLEDYTPQPLPSDFDAQRWFNTYYQQPTPEFALPALPLLLTGLPADKRAGALPPLLGFYDQLLTDNPWLLPAFNARLASCAPDEAYALSLVLGHHLRHALAAPDGIDFATWVRLEDFRTHAWPSDPDVPLTRAAQLDTLWGRFFASGLYAPLERLLTSLANHNDLGATERWQKTRADAGEPVDLSPDALATDYDPDSAFMADAPPLDVQRDVLLRTALWSIRSNVRQHPLVRAYLDWTLRAGDLPAAQKNLLQRILAAIDATPAQASVQPKPAASDATP